MSRSPSIFISYRREDSEDIAGRIYDRLKDHFGAESVFFDIDTIPLGIDFEEYIDESVSQCQIFLAIIGKSWLTASDEDGNFRLKSETDFVRLEIESALKLKIPVIPLIVRRALMPKKGDLPKSMQKLVSRHGTQVRSGKDFHKDIDELINGIEFHFQEAGTTTIPRPSGASSSHSEAVSPSTKEKPKDTLLSPIGTNHPPIRSKSYWIFQGSPRYYRMVDAIQDLEHLPWPLSRYAKDVTVGDEAIIWISGKDAGIYALGEIITSVKKFDEVSDINYWIDKVFAEKNNKRPGSIIHLTKKIVHKPLLLRILRQDKILKNLSIIKRRSLGSVFPVTSKEWKRIHHLL